MTNPQVQNLVAWQGRSVPGSHVPPDPLGEVEVLGLHRHSLGVHGAQHRVLGKEHQFHYNHHNPHLEQGGQVGLGGLLQGHQGGQLEPGEFDLTFSILSSIV